MLSSSLAAEQAQQHPRHVIYPVDFVAAGSEHVFEAVTEVLHQTIGLLMLGCCLDVLDFD